MMQYVVPVVLAVVGDRRDLHRGHPEHRVGRPPVHRRCGVLELAAAQSLQRRKCPRHTDVEPLHPVTPGIHFESADRDHDRGEVVQGGVAEARADALEMCRPNSNSFSAESSATIVVIA